MKTEAKLTKEAKAAKAKIEKILGRSVKVENGTHFILGHINSNSSDARVWDILDDAGFTSEA